jgi:hypothetical protein
VNIWLVWGSQGSYDDYYRYVVKAFTSKGAAQEYLDEISKGVDLKALSELQQLQYKYYDEVYKLSGERDYTDDTVDALYVEAGERAMKEVQEKYPNADLTLDLEFNGYFMDEQPIELVTPIELVEG